MQQGTFNIITHPNPSMGIRTPLLRTIYNGKERINTSITPVCTSYLTVFAIVEEKDDKATR